MKYKLRIAGLALGVLVFFATHAASAATLFLSPVSENSFVGQSFTVNVEVSSPDQAMNAAEGTVTFPIDKLSVISLSTAGSVANLWVQQPSFSNKDGVVNFQGVAVNPGFQGVAGKIISIVFRGKTPGTAALTFTSGSVLANDGKGTNILNGMQGAGTLLISAPPPPPTVAPTPVATSTDTVPPLPFTILKISDNPVDPTAPQPIFEWKAIDPGSGIEKYLVKIGDGDWFDASKILISPANNLYELPLQAPAENVPLTVDAYDHAGNVTVATTTFSIEPIPAPQIIEYPHELLDTRQLLNVKGRASKGAHIQVTLSRSGTGETLSFTSQADENGDWSISESLNGASGLWIMKAQAADDRGAVSAPTADLPVNIGSWYARAMTFIVNWGAIILVAILVLLAITTLIYVIKHRFTLWRLELNRELLKVRKELRDDLRRIDKDLRADEPGRNVDLSPATMRKRQERVRAEIEHIEKDLETDIKEIDKIEKE